MSDDLLFAIFGTETVISVSQVSVTEQERGGRDGYLSD